MFRAIGLLVAFYVIYAVANGVVYAKAGTGGRAIAREESPAYFWIVIAVYSGLSPALIFIF